MRPPVRILSLPWLLNSVFACTVAFSQPPTGKITSIDFNHDPVVISYDLIGSTQEDYEVILYIMRENDPSTRIQLKKVTGDVGVGTFAGNGRRMLWDRAELKNTQEGARYQFEIVIRQTSGGGIPWYFYPAAVAAGAGVWLAVRHPTSTSPAQPAASIPVPPSRP